MKNRRIMAKAKVYGFSPWVDQVDAINQIMKETGERTESILLRQLVDEALAARRKKNLSVLLPEESNNEFSKRLETIEALLMRNLRSVDVSIRILDVCLVLLQETFAEAYATRRLTWESLVRPKLREKGIDPGNLERQVQLQTDRAKEEAYRLAAWAKETQESQK